MLFLKNLWFVGVLLAPGIGAANQLTSVTYTNSIRFLFDVDGDQIDAYGSKINFFGGKYYLYGNSFSVQNSAFGIKSYSSIDLVNWAYEGFLYNPYSENPCNAIGGCGRPHIVYNPTTKKYVLWANAGSSGYIVATSTSPSTGFVFASSPAAINPKFNGLQPADFAVESYGDKAYIVHSILNFRFPLAGSIWPPIQQSLHISELTADFMNTTLVSYNVTSAANDLIDNETESPDLFIRNGIYYVAASNTCAYCNGSIGLLYRSSSIQGPWIRQILAGDSCEGQVEGVLPLENPSTGTISYVWHSTSVPGGPRIGFGGHIFQPLNFNQDGSAQDLNCNSNAEWNVTFGKGAGVKANGVASTSTDGSFDIANYHTICDSDLFTIYQTWTASKTGTLKSLSVNVAKSVQTANLTISVFKFSTIAELISPEYKWTLLGSAIIPQSSLSFVYNTTTITLNATVTKGDYLGFSFAGSDYAPYCHLEYDLGYSIDTNAHATANKMVLLQQGVGQNSWRGINGKTSVVYERPGKGMKFFATIQ